MTVLDVGHGLSVVVETARHVLIYDTGPPVGSRLDAAALAVLPYLARQGHDFVDRVVLSHGDADHAGGYRRLAESGHGRGDDRERSRGRTPPGFPMHGGSEVALGRSLL